MFKRGKKYWAKVRIRGRVVQKSLDTPNKKIAQANEAKLHVEIAEGKYFGKLPGENKKLSELKEKVVTEHCVKLCKGAASTYDKAFRFFIDVVGDLRLTEVSVRHITGYKQKRLAMGVRPATLNRELASIGKAFNIARNEWEWIRENPFSRVPKERENNIRYRWLREEEEEGLLTACPEWLRDVVIFAIYTGMRQGEIINLEWENVDLNRRCVVLLKTKTKYPRTTPLCSRAYEILSRRKQLRNPQMNNVFLNANAWRIEQAKLGKLFRAALRLAKLEDFRFHDLRHTFGTRLAQKGADIFHISKLMGHRNISTTMRYLHHSEGSLANVVNMLS
jgi:integrase